MNDREKDAETPDHTEVCDWASSIDLAILTMDHPVFNHPNG